MYKYKESISQADAFDFIRYNATNTRILLEKKGFACTQDMRHEKIALLISEVSELLDAFKKDKSDEEEAEEVADIIIRLMNIPVMYLDVMLYLTNDRNRTQRKLGLKIDEFVESDGMGKVKYSMTYLMSKAINQLDNDLIKWERYSITLILNDITDDMINLILICKIYSEQILYKNLQESIDSKMSKNHKRPYRYNTSEDLFK